MTISVLWPWVGLQCVIVVFPDRTHLLFGLVVFFRKYPVENPV